MLDTKIETNFGPNHLDYRNFVRLSRIRLLSTNCSLVR
jgi:hypothetical protein